MDDAVVVRVVERARDLTRDAERILERELPFAHETRAERLALDVRHGKPELTVGCLAGIEDAEDVRMLQLRRGGDLAAETLGAERGREIRIEHLERDAPLMLAVPREVNGCHTAAAQLTLDDVAVAERCLELIEA